VHHQVVDEEREIGLRILGEPRRAAPLEERTGLLGCDLAQLSSAA
jgi:hypothetical protein